MRLCVHGKTFALALCPWAMSWPADVNPVLIVSRKAIPSSCINRCSTSALTGVKSVMQEFCSALKIESVSKSASVHLSVSSPHIYHTVLAICTHAMVNNALEVKFNHGILTSFVLDHPSDHWKKTWWGHPAGFSRRGQAGVQESFQ